MTIEDRKKTIHKAILQLSDHLMITAEKYFRPLTEKALTDAEYGEIQLSAAVNFLRFTIYTLVSEKDREFVIDEMAKAMKVPSTPKTQEQLDHEAKLEETRQYRLKAKEQELADVIDMKKRIEDNLHKPKNGGLII